jgi:hypothetical protein
MRRSPIYRATPVRAIGGADRDMPVSGAIVDSDEVGDVAPGASEAAAAGEAGS